MTRYCTWFITIIALVLSPGRGVLGADEPPAVTDDQAQVTQTVRDMFVAAAADDFAKLRAVTTPDFFAFDAGGRFTGESLMDLIKAAHAAGKVYTWTVNEPEVHLHGDIAWITYVNRGSIKDASGTKDVSWLESAVLRKENGRWRIQFFHSTRVP
jgi:ketosteroid isomerase-like protein